MFCGQFSSLFMKRANYARRDIRNLLCQVVVPAFLVLQGLIVLTFFNFASIAGGDNLVLDPTTLFNGGVLELSRNFVPFRVPQPAGTNLDAEAIRGQFDMASVKGLPIEIADAPADAFGGCAQGAGRTALKGGLSFSKAVPFLL